jgi:hypothetical protein
VGVEKRKEGQWRRDLETHCAVEEREGGRGGWGYHRLAVSYARVSPRVRGQDVAQRVPALLGLVVVVLWERPMHVLLDLLRRD